MPRKQPHDENSEHRECACASLCIEFVGIDEQLPVSEAELDALELLLGADLRQLFSQ